MLPYRFCCWLRSCPDIACSDSSSLFACIQRRRFSAAACVPHFDSQSSSCALVYSVHWTLEVLAKLQVPLLHQHRQHCLHYRWKIDDLQKPLVFASLDSDRNFGSGAPISPIWSSRSHTAISCLHSHLPLNSNCTCSFETTATTKPICSWDSKWTWPASLRCLSWSSQVSSSALASAWPCWWLGPCSSSYQGLDLLHSFR